MAYDPVEPPFELTSQSLVALGPEYARVLAVGAKGASNVVHITPLGHAELGRRLREHATKGHRS
jgi:hypothetical protein